MTFGNRVLHALTLDLAVLAFFVPIYLAGWYDAKRKFRRTSNPSSEQGAARE